MGSDRRMGLFVLQHLENSRMSRKPTYEELKQVVKDLNKESTDRKQMEKALKESSEKIKFFAYSISHDIKSPAIGLYGLTKRLHKDYADILDEKG